MSVSPLVVAALVAVLTTMAMGVCAAPVPCNPRGRGPSCLNGGECFVATPGAAPMCSCKRGFTGTACERADGCMSFHCDNGGVCAHTVHGPRCICKPGFSGARCERASCEPPSTCQNGGTCIHEQNDTSTRLECRCTQQFRGVNCETPVSILPVTIAPIGCKSGRLIDACVNGGSCADDGACVCAHGWIGPTCYHVDICVTHDFCTAQCGSAAMANNRCIYRRECKYRIGEKIKCEIDYSTASCDCGDAH